MPNDEIKRKHRKKKKHKDIRYDDDELHLTKHGTKRARERLGIPKNAIKKNVERALKFGVPREDVFGPFRRYVDAIYHEYGTANNLRVYNRHIYIICNDVLVTILNVPYKYFDIADVVQRRRKKQLEESNGKSGRRSKQS